MHRETCGPIGPVRAHPSFYGSADGGIPASEVTLDMLANKSEAEFERYATANPARVPSWS